MALTLSAVGPGQVLTGAGAKLLFVDVTFDSSYPTGGETINLSQSGSLGAFGFASQVYMMLGGASDAESNGYRITYDRATSGAPSTGKLKVYEEGADGGAADQVANAHNLSTLTNVRMAFIGI